MSKNEKTRDKGNGRLPSPNEERQSSDVEAGSGRGMAPGMHAQARANPDDPPVHRPPQGPRGPLPGPNYLGLAGRTAIVQGQVFLVAVILIAQLAIITDALYELLSGRTGLLGWLALASGIGFALALVITLWPRRRIEEP